LVEIDQPDIAMNAITEAIHSVHFGHFGILVTVTEIASEIPKYKKRDEIARNRNPKSTKSYG
jgi:hypothetical protein